MSDLQPPSEQLESGRDDLLEEPPRVPLIVRVGVTLIIVFGVYAAVYHHGRDAGYERGAEAMKAAVFEVLRSATGEAA